MLDWEQRVRVKVDRDGVLIAEDTFFHTRIKGLTRFAYAVKFWPDFCD